MAAKASVFWSGIRTSTRGFFLLHTSLCSETRSRRDAHPYTNQIYAPQVNYKAYSLIVAPEEKNDVDEEEDGLYGVPI